MHSGDIQIYQNFDVIRYIRLSIIVSLYLFLGFSFFSLHTHKQVQREREIGIDTDTDREILFQFSTRSSFPQA
jgi:hypothetical protein